MAAKKTAKAAKRTSTASSTKRKTASKKVATAKPVVESTASLGSLAGSIGSFLKNPSRKAVIDAVLTGLSSAESERAISRMPMGQMVQRSVDHFSTKAKAIPVGSQGVTSVEEWPEEKKSLERIVGPGKEFLPAYFLVEGARRQAAVARIRLKNAHLGLPAGSGWGTGFLVSPSLLITNNHVIPDKAFAKSTLKIQFNFQNDLTGALLAVEEYDLDGDAFFLTSPETQLDYTLIRVKPNDGGLPGATPVLPGNRWGSISLLDGLIPAIGQLMNVIQHPDGRPKEIVLHQNEVTAVFPNVVHYRADTEPGSSGSPVFNNQWQLIALHHAGGKQAPSGEWLSNEGIRLDRIVADIRTRASAITGELGI